MKTFANSVGELKDIGKALDGKTYGGVKYPASDFAYTPDKDKPSTWKLRLTKKPGGAPDAHIVGAAVAALGEGFRGQRVQIPEGDRPAVIARVRAAWKQANPDRGGAELPDVLKGDTNMPMTLEQLEEKFTKVEGTVTLLKADNEFLKRENDLVTKMSKKERKAYAFMDEKQKKEFVEGDTEKRKTMTADASSKLKEKAAEDCMDAATKAEYAAAGPTVKAGMIAKALADMEKAKEKAKGGKDGAATDDNGDDNEPDNDDEETVKTNKRLDSLTDRIVKADAELLELKKKDNLNHFTEIAKSQIPNSPGTMVEKASELMELATRCGGEDSVLFKSMLGRLAAADKALNGAFSEIGKSGAGGKFQPEKELETIAKSIQGRDKVTYEKAYTVACEENPQLYADYEQMQRAFVKG